MAAGNSVHDDGRVLINVVVKPAECAEAAPDAECCTGASRARVSHDATAKPALRAPPADSAGSDAEAPSTALSGCGAATAGSGGGGGGLTYDEALFQHVGGLGRGQVAVFCLACLPWIPNAVLILQLVFALGSPVADRAWACTDAEDVVCADALAAPDPAAALCGLGREKWRWTEPSATLVAQFDLVCDGGWPLRG